MENERTQISCPRCGNENSAGAQFCNACGGPLTQAGPTTQRVTVRVSRLAIASVVLALLSCLLLYFTFTGRAGRGNPLAVMWLITSLAAIALGIVSLIQIGLSAGRVVAVGFGVIGTTLPSVVFLLMMLIALLRTPRSGAFRMVCGTNLAGIGKAMLIYSNDYDDEFPRAGGKGSAWAPKIPDWKAANRFTAYGLAADGSGGQGSISASLYLLVKYAEVEPKRFICTGDRGITEFKPGRFSAPGKKLTDLWDFGAEPWKHYSYSYHNPYSAYALTTACEPGFAVAADRNPWMASPFVKARDFGRFNPDGDREAIRGGNAVAHKYDGQNVLFVDNHVGFEKDSFCGINDDNIYTSWDGQDIRRGVPPKLGSQPADRLDSLLVNDPPVPP